MLRFAQGVPGGMAVWQKIYLHRLFRRLAESFKPFFSGRSVYASETANRPKRKRTGFIPYTGRATPDTFIGRTIRSIVLRIIHRKAQPRYPMRTKSPITWLLQRIALFSAFLVVCYAENAAAQSRPFINISARADVVNGQDVIIAGFIIQTTATTTKQVLIRGLGPSYGLSLSDPTITLNGPNGLIHSNNNWKDTQQNEIAATGMQPGNDLESAILWTLPAGSYTVTLGSSNGGTGIGLVELYDMGGAAPIVNLSSRAYVGTGNDVLIGGVYVQDGTRAVIRAIGPTLANYGIQGALANPVLELYDAQGALMASNDNWGTDGGAAEIGQLGLAPPSNLESAILPTLVPGPSTIIVRGYNNGTGVGMVELFALADEKYPRIFQAWADADNLGEDPLDTVARHDLMWTTQNGFGWNWAVGNCTYTDDYQSETVCLNGTIIPYPIPTLRSKNPNMKILVQVTLVSLAGERLPSNHQWWNRDASGNRVPAPGGGYLLNLADASLRTHVANQAKALMQTGQFDGVMLDSVNQVTPSLLLPILTEVRNAIGENGLIIVNANADMLGTSELGQVNGVFMESGKVGTGSGYPTWQTVKTALDHNELYTRSPKVNCLETWFSTSRTNSTDLKRMRATTCLSLTHSNGYALFGDSGHFHQWYDPFWSNHNLGVPTGGYYTVNGFADRRDFQNGSAIWNASTGTNLTVTFSQTRKSLATGAIKTAGQSFTVPPSDGDIFVINY